MSERSIYNYIEAGELSICNLDLRSKVKYRKRRKKQTEIKCNKFNYRQGRTYEDFQKYMEEHPDIPVVEMDTVRGLRTKEQVLLTIMFNSNSVMLMILIEDEDNKELDYHIPLKDDKTTKWYEIMRRMMGQQKGFRMFLSGKHYVVTDFGWE